jgi:hypothetical protein
MRLIAELPKIKTVVKVQLFLVMVIVALIVEITITKP